VQSRRRLAGVKCVLAVALAGMCVATEAGAAEAIHIATAARSLRQGDVVLFTASTIEPLDALRARALDRDVATFRIDSQTWQALLGIDLETKAGMYVVSFEGVSGGHAVTATTTMAIKPRVFGTRVLIVDDTFVNPPGPLLARITEEAAELNRLWTQSTPSRLWSDSFVRPVPGPANGAFGTRSIFNGERRQPHGGADFLSPAGTPVRAPNSGRVVLARNLYFTGNTVVIDHGLGLFSLMAHLSVVDVQEGDSVNRGETVGAVGATGRVTGPHLHWAVRMNAARVDPLAVLAIRGLPANP